MRVGRIGALAAVVGLLATLTAATPSAEATDDETGRIAYARNVRGNYDVYTIQADGTGPRRLTGHPAAEFQPSYSRDGRRLVFVRALGASGSAAGQPEAGQPAATELWTMNADGTDKRRVLRSPGYATCPDFSPDGRRIAFSQDATGDGTRVWTVGVDGTGLTQVSRGNRGLDEQDNCPAWSPDGNRIAFSRVHGYPETAELWVVTADGSASTELTGAGDASLAMDLAPDWKPDGSALVFIRSFSRLGSEGTDAYDDVWLVRPDGTGKTRITATLDVKYGVTWAPDGGRIAFYRPEGAATGRAAGLYTMRPDGTGERLVHPEPDPVYELSWQPAAPS
jgi:Tol biopolymer transport system component